MFQKLAKGSFLTFCLLMLVVSFSSAQGEVGDLPPSVKLPLAVQASDVELRIVQLAVTLYKDFAEIEGAFHLRNTGPSQTTFLGTPLFAAERPFTHLVETLDGDPLPAPDWQGTSRYPPEISQEPVRWVARRIYFPPGDIRVYRIKATCPYGDTPSFRSLVLHLWPGATWKESVGRVEIEVICEGIEPSWIREVHPEGATLYGRRLRWQRVDIEPVGEDLGFFRLMWEPPQVILGENLVIPAEKLLRKGELLVPLRPLATSLGLKLRWLPEIKGVEISNGYRTVRLQPRSPIAQVNDRVVILKTPPELDPNGWVMVPTEVLTRWFRCRLDRKQQGPDYLVQLQPPPQVVINGQLLSEGIEPELEGGRLFISLQGVAQILRAAILWDSASQKVEFYLGKTHILLEPGKKEALVNGQPRPMELPPKVAEGRILVPLRFLTEVLGGETQWGRRVVQATLGTG